MVCVSVPQPQWWRAEDKAKICQTVVLPLHTARHRREMKADSVFFSCNRFSLKILSLYLNICIQMLQQIPHVGGGGGGAGGWGDRASEPVFPISYFVFKMDCHCCLSTHTTLGRSGSDSREEEGREAPVLEKQQLEVYTTFWTPVAPHERNMGYNRSDTGSQVWARL